MFYLHSALSLCLARSSDSVSVCGGQRKGGDRGKEGREGGRKEEREGGREGGWRKGKEGSPNHSVTVFGDGVLQ